MESDARSVLDRQSVPCPEGPATQIAGQNVVLLRQALQSLTEEVSSLRRDLRAALAPKLKTRPFYTVRELADLLRRSPHTIRRWIRAGKIEAVKLNSGGARDPYLIDHHDVEDLILSAGTQERTLVNS